MSGSIYVHLPFCTRKCGYCHFYVVPDQPALKDQLLEGLILEWIKIEPFLRDGTIASIYFGGGTPALFGHQRLRQLLDQIKRSSAYQEGVEITLEANPEESTLELLEGYAAAGVNRLSIGVQSLDDTLLQRLTRLHNAAKARQAIGDATQAGFKNISVDLMYEIPGQSLAVWQETLQEVVQLPIHHISLYNLTIEPHTPFYTKREELLRISPPDDVARAMYEQACLIFETAGLAQYEISAFAREDAFSRHNTGYWTGRPFFGLGPSAFSYWEGKRYRNIAHLGKYCLALQTGSSPIDFEEKLSAEASRREQLVLQLRLRRGVDISLFEQQFGPIAEETLVSLKTLQQQGLLHTLGKSILLTREGQLFYDSIASELI